MIDAPSCPSCQTLMVIARGTDEDAYSCPNCQHTEKRPRQTLTVNNALDFVANILYTHDRPDAGVPWCHLRADLQEEFRARARQTVDTWASEQSRIAEESRFLAQRRKRLRDE